MCLSCWPTGFYNRVSKQRFSMVLLFFIVIIFNICYNNEKQILYLKSCWENYWETLIRNPVGKFYWETPLCWKTLFRNPVKKTCGKLVGKPCLSIDKDMNGALFLELSSFKNNSLGIAAAGIDQPSKRPGNHSGSGKSPLDNVKIKELLPQPLDPATEISR